MMRTTLVDKFLSDTDKEDTVKASELLIEHICKVQLKALGLNEICNLNKATFELTAETFNIIHKGKQAAGADALVLLHCFMPKNEIEIMPFMVKYI